MVSGYFLKSIKPINFRPGIHQYYERGQNSVDFQAATMHFKFTEVKKVMGRFPVWCCKAGITTIYVFGFSTKKAASKNNIQIQMQIINWSHSSHSLENPEKPLV